MLPIGDIIRRHKAQFHLCADDMQLYITCQRPCNPTSLKKTLTKLEACIKEIRQWMPLNGLKLNDGKTEFMILQSKNIPHLDAPNINIGLDEIGPSSTARNLGVIILDLSPLFDFVKSGLLQLCSSWSS